MRHVRYRTVVTRFAFIAFCAVLVSAESRGASNGASLVPTGSRIYDAVDYLSVLSGETTLLNRTPASVNEIQNAIDDLRTVQGNNPALAELEELIRKRLAPGLPLLTSGRDAGLTTLSLDPVATLGLSIPFSDSSLLAADKLRVANDTQPSFSLPLSLAFGDYLACRADFSAGRGYWASTAEGMWTNIPLSSSDADMNVPADAWMAAGNRAFTLAVGRGPVSIGRSLSGSMLFSDSWDRPDWVSLVFHAPWVRVSLMPVELAPDRFLYFHDLSFKPLKNLSICLQEAASVNSTLDLRYLNPAMIYHNYAGWRDVDSYGSTDSEGDKITPVGTQFGLLVDWVPIPGLKLYGQYAMNQFQTGYELSEYGDSATYIPNSIGGMAGAQWITPFNAGFLLATVEGTYANPWLYIMENRTISWVWARRELVAPGGHASDWITGWTGSPYGPDTITASLTVAYDIPFSHRIELGWRVAAQGDNGIGFLDQFVSGDEQWYPDSADWATIITPSGRETIQHSIQLTALAHLSESLEIEGKLGYYVLLSASEPGSVLAGIAATWYVR